MENNNQANKKIETKNRSVDDILAEALGTTQNTTEAEVDTATVNAIAANNATNAVKDAAATALKSEEQVPSSKIIELAKILQERDQQSAIENAKLSELMDDSTPVYAHANPNTAHLIKVNELYEPQTIETEKYKLGSHEVIIKLGGNYDDLIKAVGMAMNLIIDSGDNYIFAPNRTVIGDLVFLRLITNINLEFLTLPEIKFSQLIETYDILAPLWRHIKKSSKQELQSYYGWYNAHLDRAIAAAQEYKNSAKGIVDALANHNIKNQEEMTTQMSELDSDKLSTIVDFIKNTDMHTKEE